MNATTIISLATAEGLILAVSVTGAIKATGDDAVVNRWLPVIREHKAEIMHLLKVGAVDATTASRWLFHFAERDDLPVTFAPAVDHAQALACYPDAVAAEPIPERPQSQPTRAEANEITALVQAIYANDTDDDRAEALAAALADPDGALLCYRTITKNRGIAIAAPVVGTVKACRCCRHYSRFGYCGGRDDLPLAYGANHPLRRLPADRGASCDAWQATE